jgi:2-methylcitrate synthase
MDVMRTAVSVLGCLAPEKDDHNHPGARDIADKLMASLGSALLYWYHYSHNGKRIEVDTDDDSIGGHFLHLLHGQTPRESWVRAMHTSLNLYAEHEFNASTFTSRVIAGTGSDLFSLHRRRYRRAARAEAWRRQRGGLRGAEALRHSR